MEFSGIINMIGTNLSLLTNQCYDKQIKSEFMKNYKKLKKEKLIERHEALYKNLVEWINKGANNDQAEKYFINVGATRFEEGIPLSEVNYALFITKKVFWEFLSKEKKIFEGQDCKSIIDALRVISNYFDLGSFYIIRGYTNQLFDKLDIAAKVSREEIQKILEHGALDDEDIEASEFVWRHV